MQDKKDLSKKLEEAIELRPDLISQNPESARYPMDKKQEEYKAHVDSLTSKVFRRMKN